MQDEIKVWLEDIEKAISEINDFLPEPRNFLEFEKDIKTKSEVIDKFWTATYEIITSYPFSQLWRKLSKGGQPPQPPVEVVAGAFF